MIHYFCLKWDACIWFGMHTMFTNTNSYAHSYTHTHSTHSVLHTVNESNILSRISNVSYIYRETGQYNIIFYPSALCRVRIRRVRLSYIFIQFTLIMLLLVCESFFFAHKSVKGAGFRCYCSQTDETIMNFDKRTWYFICQFMNVECIFRVHIECVRLDFRLKMLIRLEFDLDCWSKLDKIRRQHTHSQHTDVLAIFTHPFWRMHVCVHYVYIYMQTHCSSEIRGYFPNQMHSIHIDEIKYTYLVANFFLMEIRWHDSMWNFLEWSTF